MTQGEGAPITLGLDYSLGEALRLGFDDELGTEEGLVLGEALRLGFDEELGTEDGLVLGEALNEGPKLGLSEGLDDG